MHLSAADSNRQNLRSTPHYLSAIVVASSSVSGAKKRAGEIRRDFAGFPSVVLSLLGSSVCRGRHDETLSQPGQEHDWGDDRRGGGDSTRMWAEKEQEGTVDICPLEGERVY